MDGGCQEREALNEAWARTRKIAICVHEKDAAGFDGGKITPFSRKTHRGEIALGLIRVVAAGHDEDKLGLRIEDLLPLDAKRFFARAAEDVLPTRERDHFGNPVATDVGRLEPFETQYAWAGMR